MTPAEVLASILQSCGFEHRQREMCWEQRHPWTMSDHEFDLFVQAIEESALAGLAQRMAR